MDVLPAADMAPPQRCKWWSTRSQRRRSDRGNFSNNENKSKHRELFDPDSSFLSVESARSSATRRVGNEVVSVRGHGVDVWHEGEVTVYIHYQVLFNGE